MPTPISVAKAIDAVRNAPGTRVKVAVTDIDGVLRGKYLHKEKLAILVVGNPPEFDKPLSSLGAVTNIDISIPPPPGGPPQPPAQPAQ